MPRLHRAFTTLFAIAGLAACQSVPADQERDPVPETTETAPADAYVVDVVAEDYAFEAPDEILSGWTTFRLKNEGDETHFLYLSRLPEDRTYDDYVAEVGKPFNEVWVALRSGEIDKAEAGARLGEVIPAWYWTGVETMGGPGLVAAGGVSRATVKLEPGSYVLECFMKSPEGEFHWVEGMIRPLEVAAESSNAVEPTADIRMTLTTEGFAIRDEVRPGTNTVAVHFAEQPEEGFGNDVHVVRLEEGMNAEDLVPWMDAFNVRGLQTPAPATFVGGTHERPEGRTIYFTVELEPGRYAWISEAPDVRGLFQEFTVR